MSMSAIEEALKQVGGLRVDYGIRWLTWDETTAEWVVRSQGYGQKKCRELYRGVSQDEAVAELIKE